MNNDHLDMKSLCTSRNANCFSLWHQPQSTDSGYMRPLWGLTAITVHWGVTVPHCASGVMSRRETPPLHSYGPSATHISGLLLESRCQIKLPFVSLSAEWVVFGNFTQMSGIISRNSKKPWSCWEYHTLWRKPLIMLLQINCLVHWILNRYHCNFLIYAF